VVDELIRGEITNSTYFILTERENLEQILEEIEFSLSDLADTSQTVEVGQLTSARILLAGSVTESGSSFLLNGRLVDVETGVDIPFSGIPRSDTFEKFPSLLRGVSGDLRVVLRPFTRRNRFQLKGVGKEAGGKTDSPLG